MVLFCALGFFCVVAVLLEVRRKLAGPRSISPLLATSVINDDASVIIDVRPSGEFKTGHIMGSINISATELEEQIGRTVSDRATSLLLYCKNGIQAPALARKLMLSGYSNVAVLAGGLSAWQAAQMPLEKP